MRKYVSYQEFKEYAISNNIKNSRHWRDFIKENSIPLNIPRHPERVYKDKGWIDWFVCLEYKNIFIQLSYNECKKLINDNNIVNTDQYLEFKRTTIYAIPYHPDRVYENKGWTNWTEFFNIKSRVKSFYVTYEECKQIAQSNNIRSKRLWEIFYSANKHLNIPCCPHQFYSEFTTWGDFLGPKNKTTYKEIIAKTKITNNHTLKTMYDILNERISCE